MSMPKYAMTYVVYWPEQGVLKVGRAWRFSRVQMMVRSGGHIVVLARGTDWTWEAEALKVLRRWFPKAFRNDQEARSLLFLGRGWTECFEVDEYHLQLAVDLCFEGFARGSDQGVNEKRAAEDQHRGHAVAGVHARADRSEADSAGPVADDGRPGAVRAGAGADRRGDLPGGGRDGSRDRACADARRVRVPHDLQGRRSRVDRPAAPAEGRLAAGVIGGPGAASRTFANIRGCGGSARAGAGARESRRCRAGVAVGGVGGRAGAHDPAEATSAAGRTSHRMPGSSSRSLRGLRTLRNCTPASRQVGPGGPLRGTAGRLRAGTDTGGGGR